MDDDTLETHLTHFFDRLLHSALGADDLDGHTALWLAAARLFDLTCDLRWDAEADAAKENMITAARRAWQV